jgi:hypothetical protein
MLMFLDNSTCWLFPRRDPSTSKSRLPRPNLIFFPPLRRAPFSMIGAVLPIIYVLLSLTLVSSFTPLTIKFHPNPTPSSHLGSGLSLPPFPPLTYTPSPYIPSLNPTALFARKVNYVRPSSAIERGSGFFIPFLPPKSIPFIAGFIMLAASRYVQGEGHTVEATVGYVVAGWVISVEGVTGLLERGYKVKVKGEEG